LDAASGTGVVPDWEHGVKKNVFSEIDPSRAYAWRQTATPRQLRIMHSMMGPYLERLGYDPGERVRPSPVIRAYDAALNAVFGLAFSYRLSAVRWWARVILSPMIPSSPHASLTESRRRSENALGR